MSCLNNLDALCITKFQEGRCRQDRMLAAQDRPQNCTIVVWGIGFKHLKNQQLNKDIYWSSPLVYEAQLRSCKTPKLL